ncbi:Na(+)/H(+) antiporter subunit F1 [Chengkuizengella axinellae]
MLLFIVLFVLSLSLFACFYRVIKGPSLSDRVIALDSIGINIISITAVLSIWLHTYAFLEIILLIGIVLFIGTIAFSKFIERGVVIERNRNR